MRVPLKIRTWICSQSFMGMLGLVAVLLCVRRNFLWEQFLSSRPPVENGFNIYRSTATYHVPWSKMLVPLLINALSDWSKKLVARVLSILILVWVLSIYVSWINDKNNIEELRNSNDPHYSPLMLRVP